MNAKMCGLMLECFLSDHTYLRGILSGVSHDRNGRINYYFMHQKLQLPTPQT
jgi:hypothetical protein